MTEIIEIANGEYSSGVVETISQYIKNNKIVIMPSDTIYGFLATEICEERLRDIKKRDVKPFLRLISDITQLQELGITHDYTEVTAKHWPGPVTFIMLTTRRTGGLSTVGVRLPDWGILRNILTNVALPLLSTSVNFAGTPALHDPDEIVATFSGLVDLIVVDRKKIMNTESAIVDLTAVPYKVLRGILDI